MPSNTTISVSDGDSERITPDNSGWCAKDWIEQGKKYSSDANALRAVLYGRDQVLKIPDQYSHYILNPMLSVANLLKLNCQ